MWTRHRSENAVVTLVGVALAWFVPSMSIAGEEARVESGTPQEQYSAIFKKYSQVSRGLRDAKTDLERKAAVERMSASSSKFIELAARHPQDPIALTSL